MHDTQFGTLTLTRFLLLQIPKEAVSTDVTLRSSGVVAAVDTVTRRRVTDVRATVALARRACAGVVLKMTCTISFTILSLFAFTSLVTLVFLYFYIMFYFKVIVYFYVVIYFYVAIYLYVIINFYLIVYVYCTHSLRYTATAT